MAIQAAQLRHPGVGAGVVLVVARDEEDAVPRAQGPQGLELRRELGDEAVHEVAREEHDVGLEGVAAGDEGGDGIGVAQAGCVAKRGAHHARRPARDHVAAVPAHVARRVVRDVGRSDHAPVLTVQETDYGFAYGGRRNVKDGGYYWRVTQFLLPDWSLIAAPSYPAIGHVWIPRDDHSIWVYLYAWDADKPFPDRVRELTADPLYWELLAQRAGRAAGARFEQYEANLKGLVITSGKSTFIVGADIDLTRPREAGRKVDL